MQEAAKNVFDVQVAGISLRLRSSHDAQTVSDLIKLVDQKVKDAIAANSSASFQSALILATLNIAEELLLLKKVAGRELDRVESRARVILDRIEEVSASSTN